MIRFRTALIALSLIADAGLGFAAANANLPVARVTYADLNLSSQAGRRTLSQRLDGAVSRVCTGTDSGSRFADTGCRRETMERAQADLHKAGVPSF